MTAKIAITVCLAYQNFADGFLNRPIRIKIRMWGGSSFSGDALMTIARQAVGGRN